MQVIRKARERMSSRERVLRTFAFEETDRVPIGYESNPGIHSRLKAELGARDDEELLRALGVDARGLQAPYAGPQLFPVPKDRRVNQLEGAVMRWVMHKSGGYWDFCDFPLKGAADEAFDAFPVPDPDDFDYQAAAERARALGEDFALFVGGAGVPDVLNSNGRIMSFEDILCHIELDEEAPMRLVRRRAAFQLEWLERTLAACRGRVDFLWLGEDLGTQIAPMLSMATYRRQLRPIHQQFADLARAYGIPCIVHTCGSSSWAYEDFIEMGIGGVDTLQPEAANMSPEYLARAFGGRLNFRGCISTAGPLAYGSPAEVEAICRRTLAIMMPARGYHFAPTHQIQDNTPVENVVAMYNAAHRYGVYGQ